MSAATNSAINFQARVLTNTGAVVPDGYYNVEFKLYTASSGGSAAWTETYYDTNGPTAGNDNRMQVKNGYVTANLGTLTAFASTIDWSQEIWLSMNIGGTSQTATPTWDGEMNPRMKVTAVPYAFRAAEASELKTVNGANVGSLSIAAPTGGSQTFVVPDQGAAGTFNLCVQNSSACGFALLSGSNTFTGVNTFSAAGTALSVTNDATIGGTLGVTGLTTATGGLTVGTGSLFTNGGATLNNTLAITNKDYTGSGNTGTIGSAASTVDIYTNFTIAQTTAGQTLTIPAPTTTTSGRLIYITNIGSAGYTMAGAVVSPGVTMQFVWNSTTSSWSLVTSGVSGSYIQNGTSVQTANFNIQSNAVGSVTATIQGANSQTANVLEVKAASVSNPLFSISPTGQTVFQNSTDSTTALQVKNSSGTAFININSISQTLTLTSKSNASVLGGDVFGVDNNTCTGVNWADTGVNTWSHTAGSSANLSCSTPLLAANTAYVISYTTSGTTAGETFRIQPIYGGVSGFIRGDGSGTVTITNTSNSGIFISVSSAQTGSITITSIQPIISDSATLRIIDSSNRLSSELRSNISGNSYLGLGFMSLQSNTTGYSNSAFGGRSLASNTTGYHNSAFGNNSLSNNISGYLNSSFGSSALSGNYNGYQNAAFGANSLGINYIGYNNTAFGTNSLFSNTTGYNNTALGVFAGNYDSLQTQFNTLSNLQGSTMIGVNSQAYANNVLALGGQGSNAVKVGIGTGLPTNQLSAESYRYSTGTVTTNATTTVTGTGTTFTSDMVGNVIYIATNSTTTAPYRRTITGFTDASTITVDSAVPTLTNAQYYINYVGLQVSTSGNTGINTLAPNNRLSVNSLSTADSTAQVAVSTNGVANKGLVVQGVTSQTADLLQLQNSSASVLTGFNASGSLYYANSGFTTTLNTATLTADQTITLPNESGTLCIQNSTNCGFATGSGTAVLLAPASAQTDATNNASIYINKTGASGNLLQLQKGGADVFTINNTGAVTVKNTTNSTTAFQIQPSGSTTPVFNVDTTNLRVGIGTNAPTTELEVVGDITSTGTKWTSRTSAADNDWRSVTYGNGLFVAVANTGTGDRVMTSPDGINWTARSSAADNDWTSVTYGNGLFVAVAQYGAGNFVMTSPDGINWTARSSAVNTQWRSVTYGNGLFVAVASSGTGDRVMTSPDGINWTSRTSASDNYWRSVTYGNGLFVAVASSGTGDRVMTSPDGINWTARSSAADNDWISVTYGNGLFVAVASSGTGDRVMTSPDGINWTSRTPTRVNSWTSVSYGNSLFVAVSIDGTGDRVMTSPDGINWTARSSAADNSWRSVTYGNGLFVSVSFSGTGNRVMTSGKQDLISVSNNNTYQGGMSVYGGTRFISDANSTTAFRIQNNAGTSLFTVDTTNTAIAVDATMNLNGNTTIGNATTDRLTVTSQILGGSPLVFQGATDDGFTTTLAVTDPTANNTITFPDASGTVQLAPASGSYIKQVPTSTAENTITPTANSVVGLTVNGTSGTAATALNVVQGGNASALVVNATGAGTVLQLQKSGNDLLSLSNTGALLVQNSADSTAAFQVKTSTGGTNVVGLNYDTTNQQLSVRNKTDAATLGSDISAPATGTGTNWTGTNPYTHTAGSAVALTFSSPAITANTTYEISYTTAGTTVGASFTPSIGGVVGQPIYGNVTEAQLITTINTGSLVFIPTSNAGGTITLVSLKIVTNSTSALVVKDSTGAISMEVRADNYTGNLGLGLNSLQSNTIGSYNTATGFRSLQSNTEGTDNTAIGTYSLQANTAGYNNTATGSWSLASNTTGYSNTATGAYSLQSNTTGYSNTATGNNSLQFNTTGFYNTAIGDSSLVANTTGAGNTASGFASLTLNTTGDNNSAVGYESLRQNDTGDANTAMGNGSMYFNDSGSGNAAFGVNSLYYGNGSYNTAIGYNSLNSNGTGSYNSALGYNAGYNGTQTEFKSLNNIQGSTMIGAYSQAYANNVLALGGQGTNSVKVGIGTGLPTNQLSAESYRYSTGTVTTNGTTTVTGTGTTFTTDMVGNVIYIATNSTTTAPYARTITGYTSATQITVSSTVPALTGAQYYINYAGLQVTTGGRVGIGTLAPTTELEVVGDITSTGTKWTARTGGADNDWRSVTYGNGMFVAVSVTGTNNRVMTSTDGINWTARTTGGNSWQSVTYGNGMFVAVASSGTDRVMTSTDGITWTTRPGAPGNQWVAVTYGNGLFVAVAVTDTGNNRVMTSPDGINWTARTSAANNSWASVTYGNGMFVAVSYTGSLNDRVMTSPDGITWTIRDTSGKNNSWRSVTYGNGLFVAVASNGTSGQRVMTSPDGITWTIRTSASDSSWYSVTYGDGLFVATAITGTGQRVMTSPDGINWTLRNSGADSDWYGVTYGNGMFVAVGNNASAGNRAMTSGKQQLISVTNNNTYQGGMSVYGGTRFISDANSTTAFRIQNNAGTSLFTVDTTNTAIAVDATMNLNGNTTIGNATTDRLTVTSQILGGNAFVFQGGTDDGFTTTLAVTDPTANNTITFPDASGTVQLAPASGSYIKQVPTSTAENTITPTANSVVGLTVNGTSGTAATALAVSQPGAAAGITVTSANNTATNGLSFSGTFTNLINSTNFNVTNAGAVTAVGIDSGTGLLQGTGGLTLTGTTSINTSGANTTNIGTGTNTGTIGIGSATAGIISIQSAGAVNTTAGAASTISTSAGALTLTSAAAATWSTTAGNLTLQAGSGTVSLGTSTALIAAGALGITSGGANALTLDTGGVATLSIGGTNANAISISRAGVTTMVYGDFGVSHTTNLNGNTTIGDNSADRLTVTSQILGASPFVFQGATDDGFSTTFTITNPTANNTITFPDASGTVQLAPASGSYIKQVPTTNADNTIQPTAAGVTGLTVTATNNGTTGATALVVNQGNVNGGTFDGANINVTNTSGTIGNGLLISKSGAGTVTSLLNLTQSAGTATNGIIFNGTIGTDITTAAARELKVITGTTGALTLDTGTTGAINIGTNANAKTIAIGNTTGASILNLVAGTGTAAGDMNLYTAAGGIINIGGNAVTNKVLNLGSTGTTNAASTINIANTNANQTQAVNIGNTTSANNVVWIQGGTSATALRLGAGSGGTITVGSQTVANTVSIGTVGSAAFSSTVNIGNSTGAAQTVSVGSTNTTSTTTIQAGSGNVNVNASTLQFTAGANRTINVASAATPNTLTVAAGSATGVNTNGAALYLQGGSATNGNASGGNVFVQGGTGIGTGAKGLVVLDTATYLTAATQSSAVDVNITQANIDSYGAIVLNATAADVDFTLTSPTLGAAAAGRVVYVTAANGSNDFTLRANVGGGVGVEQNIAMRQNTTATMIWNGTQWTAAGASSSTTLQAAYDNTLSSAGGAEIVLNNSATANGLTVRNNASSAIIGGIFEAQTSIGSNLFSVNNNATEFATNGGAETIGATASTFPANTWDTTSGGTVDRYTTAGDSIATGAASVRVQTTTTNHGARNRLSTTLTSGLTYSVSFAIRGATNFSTLDVRYSPDGTTTGTTQCTTAEVVTSGIWTRINCTFVASGTITAANSILIRQTDATARTFYIDNLSVNINASATYAADGSVDNAGAFATNWTAYGAGSVAARDTTVIYDSSASARVDTTNAADRGITNNLSILPAVNTQYLVSFYARAGTGAINDLTVRYSRNGGTNFVSCVDYSTQVINTSGWTKITCLFTTDGTTATNADIVITQATAPGGTRSIYVDALAITLNTNNANNVQIGGANKGGPTTLFTLDRADTAPIAANNDAYLGSMYYDTTTGRIQCYEADGWGACGSAPDNIVNLNPEYAGAVLNGTGVGTMTADLCADQSGVLQVNAALCDGTGTPAVKATNYYKWTSPQASQQTYSIYVSYQLPTTFKGFASDDTVQLTARVDSTTNAAVTYEMFRSEGGTLYKCGTGETAVTTNPNEWQTVGINGNESTGCGFSSSSGGAYVIFKINVKANSNANAYVSTLSFTTTGK